MRKLNQFLSLLSILLLGLLYSFDGGAQGFMGFPPESQMIYRANKEEARYQAIKEEVVEIIKTFPPGDYHYVGLGQSPSVLLMSLEAILGSNAVSYLPGSDIFNYFEKNPACFKKGHCQRLHKVFNYFLPQREELKNKKILVLDYYHSGDSLNAGLLALQWHYKDISVQGLGLGYEKAGWGVRMSNHKDPRSGVLVHQFQGSYIDSTFSNGEYSKYGKWPWPNDESVDFPKISLRQHEIDFLVERYESAKLRNINSGILRERIEKFKIAVHTLNQKYQKDRAFNHSLTKLELKNKVDQGLLSIENLPRFHSEGLITTLKLAVQKCTRWLLP